MPHRSPARPFLTAVLSLLAILTSGCGVETALLAAGMGAAQSGVTQYSRGELKSYELVRFDDATIATELAIAALDLTVTNQRDMPYRMWYAIKDDQDKSFQVTVERRSERVTAITISMGMWGPRGLGSLLLSQILHELGKANAYLENWNRNSPRGTAARERKKRGP